MVEKCGHSMQHWEHMCSYTDNGCAVEALRSEWGSECSPCDDKSHWHYAVCTSSYIAA